MTDLRQFRYFLAVVDHGSFSRAADALHVSQPSLSVAVKALESDVGVSLLVRSPRGVQVTTAGDTFARRARTAVREADRALSDVRQSAGLERSRVTIGLGSMLTAFLGPEAIAAFRDGYPDVDLTIDVSTHQADEIARAIDGALWDFGVVLTRPHSSLDTQFNIEPLTSFESGVYAAPNHPLISKTKASLADLAEYDWIMSSATAGASFLYGMFDKNKVARPRVSTVTNSFNLIRELAASSPCLSLLPHPFVRKAVQAGDMAMIKQSHISITSSVSLIYPRDTEMTVAAKSLMDHIQKASRAITG